MFPAGAVGLPMASAASLVAGIGEIALRAVSRAEFRLETLRALATGVGAEAGAICSDFLVEGNLCEGHHLLGGEALENRFSRAYLRDFEPDLPRLLRAPAWSDREALSRQRRQTASLYREYLPRVGVRRFVARCWSDQDGFHLITLAPHRSIDHRRFFSRARAALDAAFPIIALGERVHRPAEARSSAEGGKAPGRPGLTPAEGKVVALVERGLTNPEIAGVLSISPNTVRNRLAAVFRKLDVSRRAELVYQLRQGR